MLKVLVTGARGQLGRELLRSAAAGKTELGSIPGIYDGCAVTEADIDELNITDIDAVSAFVSKHGPDIIFNCAAMTDVDACESDWQAAFTANALGPRNLAVAARETNATLMHISTDYVFSGDGVKPYCEWDLTEPKTVYGKSKLLGEQYVRNTHHKHFIVRTSWLYGYDGRNFVKTIVKAARERGFLKVVDDQRGCPTHAGDLAHHMLKLAASREYGLYHCAGNGECSRYNFACEIVRLAGITCKTEPCTTEEFPRPAPRPSYSPLDNLALSCTVGDEMRPWRDALTGFFMNWKEREL